MRARVLYINTHAGQAIREGGLAWAKREFGADLTVLVEVGRTPAQELVREIFPKERHSIVGRQPRDEHLEVRSGTLIIAKRSVLKKKWSENTLLTPQRWVDGKRDRWHPIRRLTRARYAFANHPEVDLEVGADHAWTIAGFDLSGQHEVPTQHRAQIQAFANKMRAASAENRACLDVGDMNQPARPGSDLNHVERTFKAASGRPLVAHNLDYVFGNHKVELDGDPIIIPALRIHSDHDAIVIDVKVRP